MAADFRDNFSGDDGRALSTNFPRKQTEAEKEYEAQKAAVRALLIGAAGFVGFLFIVNKYATEKAPAQSQLTPTTQVVAPK